MAKRDDWNMQRLRAELGAVRESRDAFESEAARLRLIAETNEKLAWELVNMLDPEARGKSPLLLLKDLIRSLPAEPTR